VESNIIQATHTMAIFEAMRPSTQTGQDVEVAYQP